MKVKKFDKALTLNKRTVAHLGGDAMKDSKGGASHAHCTTSYDMFCHYTYCQCETELPFTCLTCIGCTDRTCTAELCTLGC